jgi:hypothetical protein
MSYIIKNTSGLINSRLTDVGRRYLSQGNFNISYFQIGDSEVSYSAVPSFNLTNNNILMPAFDAQNDTGSPQSNKQNIKYPYYVQGNRGNTYGIPFMDSNFQEIYNSASEKGFFVTGGTPGSWTAQTSSAYTITSNYYVEMDVLDGQNVITIYNLFCSTTTSVPKVGDYISIIYDGDGGCGNFGTYPILFYKIQDLSPAEGTPSEATFVVTLDRPTPIYTGLTSSGQIGRVLVYPEKMTDLYDSVTPLPYWQTDTLNFESPCDVINRENTPIWNMNIPWTESPAGINSTEYETYISYGSVGYVGSKEYLGYNEPSGQTFYVSSTQPAKVTDTFYYNSYDEKVEVLPQDQKTIAIIHFTNQDIDHVYGEKFSTIPYDPQNPTDNIGLARHFQLTLPTLMWHKSSGSSIGQTFWIDPPSYDLCKPAYIKSSKNTDMNDPGIRYFHLWDTNPDDKGNLNRIGKVFPDQEIIVIDDEEVVAALSYKSNRNWTLPAPKLSLITPNVCSPGGTQQGVMSAISETMWVTYWFGNTNPSTGVSSFTQSMHCNYYSKITTDSSVTASTQNVAIRFGNEFKFLNQPTSPYTSSDLSGFCANQLYILFQKTTGNTRPDPATWLVYDVTPELTATTVNGYITMSGITGNTFQIDASTYNSLVSTNTYWDLGPVLNLPQNGETDKLNFGDEYFFYGNLKTDISATIYEMKYLINLGRNQFTNTSNPTWMSGTTSYVTEIGLYNQNKDLMVVSKLQSPELRQGIQQFVVKLDF